MCFVFVQKYILIVYILVTNYTILWIVILGIIHSLRELINKYKYLIWLFVLTYITRPISFTINILT
jgi:hypothetical protein